MTQLICGIVRLDGTAPEEATVRRMAAAMVAPGLPHRVQIAIRGKAALAAVRLSLRGASGDPEEPALVVSDDRIVAADVSIYDRGRTRLTAAAAAVSDAAFLDAALAERGAAALGDIHGVFAVALWCGGRLVVARDHFGARPAAYTFRDGQYFAFASSPAALLRTGLASRAVDEEVAATWMLQSTAPPGRTIYRDIRPVDPAHLVECSEGVVSVRRYWRLDISQRLPLDSDPQALAAETARLLKQAVMRRLPQSGPGAGHLSGGLDSSPIAVLAAREAARSGRAFLAYTFREPEHGPGLPGAGDAPVAAMVAAAEPAITEVPIVSPSLLMTYAEGIDPDTLLPISSADPEEQILRHASSHGAPMILSGWGGDQIVSYHGRGAEAELFWSGRFLRLWRHLRAESAALGVGIATLVRSTILVQGLPKRFRELLRAVARREGDYEGAIAQRSRLAARHRRGGLLVETPADYGDTFRIRRDKAEAWHVQTRMAAFALQGARHGLTYAYPMLDLDLVEFSIQVPGVFLRCGGGRRRLLREAVQGILPEPVRLSPLKLRPFPGEELRNAAARDRLLGIVAQWRRNARIRDLLDLDFIEEMIRIAGSPLMPRELEVVDLTPAFQIGALLTALDESVAPREVAGAAR